MSEVCDSSKNAAQTPFDIFLLLVASSTPTAAHAMMGQTSKPPFLPQAQALSAIKHCKTFHDRLQTVREADLLHGIIHGHPRAGSSSHDVPPAVEYSGPAGSRMRVALQRINSGRGTAEEQAESQQKASVGLDMASHRLRTLRSALFRAIKRLKKEDTLTPWLTIKLRPFGWDSRDIHMAWSADPTCALL